MPERSRILFSQRDEALARAGEPLAITASSRELAWRGVELERGSSSVFEPTEVTLPFHYFALLTSDPYTWEWKDGARFRRHTMHPGQIWVNPAGVPFTHRVGEYSEFVLLKVDPERVLDSVPDARLRYGSELRRVHNADDPQLRALIHALAAEVEAGGPNGSLFVDGLLTAFSTHFLATYGTERLEEAPRDGLDRKRLTRVLEYVDANLGADVGLDELAGVAGLSKYHFARAFKTATGTTPHRWLLRRRLERGRALLERGDLPIARIAADLGFSDQSHFGRAFKRRYGTTPGRVRRGG